MIPFVPPILSGLAVSYSISVGDPVNDTDSTNNTYSVTFQFRDTTSSTIDILRNINADTIGADDYAVPAAGGTLYVRCTQNSGTSLNVGDTTGVWHTLTTSQERGFGLNYTTSGGPDLINANIDLELASDSGGTNILAQQLGIDIEVGQT